MIEDGIKKAGVIINDTQKEVIEITIKPADNNYVEIIY
jgi:hypothetical protein